MVTGPRAARSRRSWSASTPTCWVWSGSGSMTHSSIWVGIRCWRCACLAAINTALDVDLSVPTVFDAPTVAQLALRVGVGSRRLQPLVPVERPAVVPLSYAQQRLWFIDQLQGPSPVYNMAAALRLGGLLDAEALRAALADVVGRHESLRTLLAAPEGIPQQLVVPPERADFGWEVVDATGWSAVGWMRPSARWRVTV